MDIFGEGADDEEEEDRAQFYSQVTCYRFVLCYIRFHVNYIIYNWFCGCGSGQKCWCGSGFHRYWIS
jgi:hypothetical protein